MWDCRIEIVVAVVAGAGGVVLVYGCSSAPSGLWCVGMTQDNRQPHLPPSELLSVVIHLSGLEDVPRVLRRITTSAIVFQMSCTFSLDFEIIVSLKRT